MFTSSEPVKNTTALRLRPPIQRTANGITRHPASVPTFTSTPLHAAITCAWASGAPCPVSFVITTVGIQNVEDHSPKIAHDIISAAAQVVRACCPVNSPRAFALRCRTGSASYRRRL